MLKRAILSFFVLALLVVFASEVPTAGAKAVKGGKARAAKAKLPRLGAETLAPADGDTVSGRISWRAGAGVAAKLSFAVDGAVKRTVARSSSFSFVLDTTTLSDGPHSLTVIAAAGGRVDTDRVTVNVANGRSPSPSRPLPAPKPTPVPTPTPAPTPNPMPEAPIPTPSDSSLYWGAWIGNQYTGNEAPWDAGAIDAFERIAQKRVSSVHFAAPFADCSRKPCSFYSFPTTPMENIRKRGAIPFFSWSSQGTGTASAINQPDFQLSDVIAGSYDSYIRSFATAARNWGHPFFLRFNWEMNGNWFPWSEGVNGNQRGEYVKAWRHVHDIFTQVGATNATWTWCPNVDARNEFTDIASLYPGDSYVDWTCLDGYNWGGSDWQSFDQIYSSTYHRIVDGIAPTKPMIIGEVGSSEKGGSKSAWIADMLRRLPVSYPQIHGLLWFDKYVDGDWPISTSTAAGSAFAAGISVQNYLAPEFASLSAGKVPTPS